MNVKSTLSRSLNLEYLGLYIQIDKYTFMVLQGYQITCEVRATNVLSALLVCAAEKKLKVN